MSNYERAVEIATAAIDGVCDAARHNEDAASDVVFAICLMLAAAGKQCGEDDMTREHCLEALLEGVEIALDHVWPRDAVH